MFIAGVQMDYQKCPPHSGRRPYGFTLPIRNLTNQQAMIQVHDYVSSSRATTYSVPMLMLSCLVQR